jgi:hypothetical protein
MEELGPMPESLPLLMDRAYEGNETRQLVLDLEMIPVVPLKSNRLHPWDYDHARLEEAQRDRRSLPPTQRLPSYLLAFRETRRAFPWVPLISHSSSRPCA